MRAVIISHWGDNMNFIDILNKHREERKRQRDDMQRAKECRNAILTNVCPKHCQNCAYFRGVKK